MNGIYYYKLQSPYEGDVTKNCKLNITEIDSNFYNLKSKDIVSANFDETEKTLNLETNDKTIISVDMLPALSGATQLEDYSFAETSGGTFYANFKSLNENRETETFSLSFDKVTGKLTITDKDNVEHEIGEFVTTDNIKDKIDTEIYTDTTILGNGSSHDPIYLNPTEKTGFYAPAIAIIDTTSGETLPDSCKKGDRYVVRETMNIGGRLYNYNGVREIESKLTNGWRIPTKSDWDDMLNALEDPEYRNHDSRLGNIELGKEAGKKLKSADKWENNSGGTDNFGMCVYPAGYGTEEEKIIALAGRQARLWSKSQTVSGNTDYYDYYVKIFKQNVDGVYQIASLPDEFCSLRLVKDYSNDSNDAEFIFDRTYTTVTMPSINATTSHRIWLGQNVDYEVAEGNQIINEDENFQQTVYTLNVWDGENWLKKVMQDGDTIVITNGNSDDASYDREYRVYGNELKLVAQEESAVDVRRNHAGGIQLSIDTVNGVKIISAATVMHESSDGHRNIAKIENGALLVDEFDIKELIGGDASGVKTKDTFSIDMNEVSEYSGKTISSEIRLAKSEAQQADEDSTTDTTDTVVNDNVLRIIKDENEDIDNPANGLYLSSVWDCGTY